MSTLVYNRKEESQYAVATKNGIYDCAKELFFSKGIRTTTMSNIADKSYLSRRTIYRYYDSKKILVTEVLFDVLSDLYDFILSNDYERTKSELYNYLVNNSDHLQFLLNFTEYVDSIDISNNEFTSIAYENVSNLTSFKTLAKKNKKSFFEIIGSQYIYNLAHELIESTAGIEIE